MVYVGAVVPVPPGLNLGFDRGAMLYADSVAELFEMSRRLGLLDKWVKRDGPKGTSQERYFWVPESKRRQAVQCGARDVWNQQIAQAIVDGSIGNSGLFGEGAGRVEGAR